MSNRVVFEQLRNIDTAFKHVRLFSCFMIAACVAICTFTIYKSYEIVTNTQERIYILSNGKALEAWSADRKDNIPVEIRDHVKMFHHYFFTLDPDDKVIEANVTKALYLADASAKRQYDDLKESRYYSNIISGNISQEIQVDSVQIDVSGYPFYFKCFAKQRLIRTTSVVTRSLISEGIVRNVSRSDNNPHGFLIERWLIIENKDIKTERR